VAAVAEGGEGTAVRTIRALGVDPNRLAAVARDVLIAGAAT